MNDEIGKCTNLDDKNTILDQLVIICAVNNENTLRRDLMSSPLIRESKVPIFTYRDANNIAEAYNKGISETDKEIMVFAHQDVYLPQKWELLLANALSWFESHDIKWGVLGTIGVNSTGNFTGRTWSSGLSQELNFSISSPSEVESLDELILIIRRSSGLHFDPDLPHFHLYGTDIVQIAKTFNLSSFTINAPVIHNSNQITSFDNGYGSAFKYFRRKWSESLPIHTPICIISRYGLGLILLRIKLFIHLLIQLKVKRIPLRKAVLFPQEKAKELGYE